MVRHWSLVLAGTDFPVQWLVFFWSQDVLALPRSSACGVAHYRAYLRLVTAGRDTRGSEAFRRCPTNNHQLCDINGMESRPLPQHAGAMTDAHVVFNSVPTTFPPDLQLTRGCFLP